jgi:hypothetical protein
LLLLLLRLFVLRWFFSFSFNFLSCEFDGLFNDPCSGSRVRFSLVDVDSCCGECSGVCSVSCGK